MAIVLDKFNIAYFSVPKVACTSLKRMFYFAESGEDFKPFFRNGKKIYVHKLYPCTAFSKIDSMKIQSYFKICVVRDPVSRFLSCYSNRVQHHWDLAKGKLSDVAVTSGALPNPSLEDFVDRIELYRRYSHSIWHHTNSQCFFLGREKDFYSKVYTMSELDTLRCDMSSITKMNLELPHVQKGGKKLNQSVLSSNAKEKIRKMYDVDYQTYNFA
ncbi:sulfotransferase family 2 domain-containing protein [Donghicola sp. XS_ASV15]|uniref:sulfotransferase family 2 domain-containing protein n=1 Tax=Donghicola sp. XS_ASV15 TaxID=3241295 RepID=UPI0035184C03